MDAAYTQHASYARRKNRSITNVNHLSLAPLTTKLPLTDAENLPDIVASPLYHNPSYLQGKSAPTTPRLLQSPSLTRPNSPRRRSSMSLGRVPEGSIAKSKSTTHLRPQKALEKGIGGLSLAPRHRHGHNEGTQGGQSDWMLRTGALISSETRESKGQAWLVSRASSTNLAGTRDADERGYEWELARENQLSSRRVSRRGSASGLDDDLVSPASRYASRSHSRLGNLSQLRTPLERVIQDESAGSELTEEDIPGPDFVGLDEKLEAINIDTSKADEATIRRLVWRRSGGVGAWVWSLFAAEENDEDSDTAEGDMTDAETENHIPRSASTMDFDGFSCPPVPQVPPPKEKDGTGWQDAAWLLSVASKVLF
ncbi:hypothetical protein GGR50DRAFT_169545 [Xylaria sp. CBS 124048]|nr:hypothetical protein GGR50DRAFT_169545 [Xylaria sp. CBS 124048]